MNGDEARRNLYFSQPARGLPGMEQGTLVEVIKGVFGLSTSPRLWWERLSRDLLQLDIKIKGQSLKLEQHELDACYFLLRDGQGELHGALITHVDDLLIAAPEETLKDLQVQLSSIFPISEWETGSFDYTGSQISQDEDGIHVAQKSYVNSRLEVVEVPKEISNDETADAVTRSDNQSMIGALSWLSSQSRPDLQAAVSLAQKRQKNPSFGDVKDTNRAVKMAQIGKDEKLDYKRLAPGWNDLMILVYHDAAWANARPRDGGAKHGALLAAWTHRPRLRSEGVDWSNGYTSHCGMEIPFLSTGLSEHFRGGDYGCFGGLGRWSCLPGNADRKPTS